MKFALRLLAFLTLLLLWFPAIAQQKSAVLEIYISGLNRTKEAIVLRELSFHKGDSILSEQITQEIAASRDNVYNLGLFNTVDFDYEQGPNGIIVLIRVKERWYIFPFPHLDIEERNSYDLLKNLNLRRLVYGINLNWRNVTGRNETLSIFGQLGFSQRLRIDYLRPAIFPKPNIDLIAGFGYINEKEIIYGTEKGIVQWGNTETQALQKSFEGYLGLRKRFSVRRSLYGEFSYKAYLFSDSINVYNPRFIPSDNNQAFYPAFALVYINDTRDWLSYPLSGFKSRLILKSVGLAKHAKVSYLKLGFTWAHHIPISKRWNIAYGFHNMLALGKHIPYFEKNFIGIDQNEFSGLGYNLRGYERYAIDGTFVHMTKVELKYAIVPRRMIHLKKIPLKRFRDLPFGLYLSAFNDLAYVSDNSFNNQDNYLKNTLLNGYGVGINVIGFYDLMFRFELSRNLMGENGFNIHATVPIK